VSLVPALIGLSGSTYLVLALALGTVLLTLSVRFARFRSLASARALFLGSIVYLPLLWIVMIVDRL
jgi:protoheme IX farnesyltransferase